MVIGGLEGETVVGGSVVGCWWSVGWWRISRYVGGRLSVVGGSVEDLSVNRWSVFGCRWDGGGPVSGFVEDLSLGWWSVGGGRWPVGVRWFCNTSVNYAFSFLAVPCLFYVICLLSARSSNVRGLVWKFLD